MLKGDLSFIYKNWSGVYFCKPKSYFEPQTIQDINDVFKN